MGACVSITLRKKWRDQLKKIITSERMPQWAKEAAIRNMASSEKKLNERLLARYQLQQTRAQRDMAAIKKERFDILEEERKWIMMQKKSNPEGWTDDLVARAETEWKRGFLKAIKKNAKRMAACNTELTKAEHGVENSQEKIAMCDDIFSKVGSVSEESQAEFLSSVINDNYEMQSFQTMTNAPGPEFSRLAQSTQHGAPVDSVDSASQDAALISILIKELTASTTNTRPVAQVKVDDAEYDEVLYVPPAASGRRPVGAGAVLDDNAY